MAYDVMPYAQAVLDVFPEKKKDGFDRVMEVTHLLMDGTVGTVCTTINSVFQMYALMQGKKEARSDKLSEQINFLNRQIANATGQKKNEYMQQHKECCTRHQRLSKMKNVFGARNTQYLQKVKEQNAYTKQCREYIISNFGEKGRAWGERLKKRKVDLVGDS